MKKKLCTILLLCLLTSPSFAMVGITKENYVACLKKQWIEDIVSFLTTLDEGSFNAYIDTKKCIMMKPGLRVTVTEWPGMFGSYAEFIFEGTRFWTVRKGLEYAVE